MRWKRYGARRGHLFTRIRKLDIVAEDLGEEILLKIIADSIESGDWGNISRKWRAAFKKIQNAT